MTTTNDQNEEYERLCNELVGQVSVAISKAREIGRLQTGSEQQIPLNELIPWLMRTVRFGKKTAASCITASDHTVESGENFGWAVEDIVDCCRREGVTPISVPPDWTPEQDLEFYEDHYGCDAPDYAEGLRNAIRCHCAGLVEVVDAALTYFYGKDLTLFPFPLECLSVSEKLDILESIISASARESSYHDRFKENISLCRWAEAERGRVFAEHHKCGGKSWLYPLVKVTNLCGGAAFVLRESMICEHEDLDTTWRPGTE